jgi:mono/diheme cytochrome c family protein
VDRRRLPLLGALLLVVLAAAGCGTGGPAKGGDPSRGRELFLKVPPGQKYACSTCHTLKAAGAQGTIGPNLDDAFAASKAQGFKESTIRDAVLDQIRLAACVDPSDLSRCMPKNLLRGQDAQDVAEYVARCAADAASPACSGGKITGTSGKDIFLSSGCGSCHTLADAGTTGKIGPDLDKQLAPDAKKAGKPLAEFTRESIVDPNAFVAPGYPKGVMPTNFGKTLSKAQLETLVKYLAQQAK